MSGATHPVAMRCHEALLTHAHGPMRYRVIGSSRPRSMRQAAEAGLLRPPPPRAAPPAWQHTEQWSAVPRTTIMQRSAIVPAAAGALGWGPRLSIKSPPPPWLLGASQSQPPQAPLNARTEEDWDAWAHAGEEQVRASFLLGSQRVPGSAPEGSQPTERIERMLYTAHMHALAIPAGEVLGPAHARASSWLFRSAARPYSGLRLLRTTATTSLLALYVRDEAWVGCSWVRHPSGGSRSSSMQGATPPTSCPRRFLAPRYARALYANMPLSHRRDA